MAKDDPHSESKSHMTWLYAGYREKLEEYASLLECEFDAIGSGKTEKLEEYVRADGRLAEAIGSMRKCIREWQNDTGRTAETDDDVLALESETGPLMEKIKEKIERNRALCSEKLASIEAELESVRGKRGKSSPYSRIARPGIIDKLI